MDRDVLHCYNFNKDFHEYVKRYCAKHETSVETALTHSTVLSVYEYYRDAEEGEISVSNIVVGCGAASGGDCK